MAVDFTKFTSFPTQGLPNGMGVVFKDTSGNLVTGAWTTPVIKISTNGVDTTSAGGGATLTQNAASGSTGTGFLELSTAQCAGFVTVIITIANANALPFVGFMYCENMTPAVVTTPGTTRFSQMIAQVWNFIHGRVTNDGNFQKVYLADKTTQGGISTITGAIDKGSMY